MRGTKTSPGTSGGSASGVGTTRRVDSTGYVYVDPPVRGTCPDAIAPCAFGAAAPTPTPAAPAAPGTPAVTLADIATFRPAPSAPTAEPNGWGIAGLDTNFVAAPATQVVSGTLLGRPASVRFTPATYTWTYGDGASRTTSNPGATWASSGVREFDPTPTSHVYARPGDYTAQLTVGYTASYSWDGSAFTPIDGTVSTPGGTLPIRIVVESTVLVGSGCTPGTSAPGC